MHIFCAFFYWKFACISRIYSVTQSVIFSEGHLALWVALSRRVSVCHKFLSQISRLMIGHVYTEQIVYAGQSPGARLYRLCTLVRALPSHTTTVLSLSVVEYMCTSSHPWGKTVPEEASRPVIIYDRSLHRLSKWLVINITYNTVNNRKGILAWVSMLQLYAHRNQE